MIERALAEHLKTEIAQVVNRVYPLTLPQSPPNPQLPAITYQLVTEPRSYSLDGVGASNPYFQIDCWAATYAGAQSLAEAVTAELDAFNGFLGVSPNQVRVTGIFQRARRDSFEPVTGEYRVSLDYSIWHN